MGFEADSAQGFEVEDVAAIEDEGGLEHVVVDRLEIEFGELIPFGEDSNGMSIFAGFSCRGMSVDVWVIFRNTNVLADLFV